MSSSNKTIAKKQQVNLEKANKWLRRAKMDFNAFKRMVPVGKNIRKGVRCTDPALAVYLLQQSIEKAAKSVAVATGKYSDSRLRSHSHNSLKVLLDFYRESLNTIIKQPGFNAVGMGFGIDFTEGLDKIMNLIVEVGKTSRERTADKTLYREQFAMATDAGIEKMLDMLLLLRSNAFIGIPKSIFGPHGKVVIDKQKLNTSTPKDFVSSTFSELEKKLNIPRISENNLKLLEDVVGLLAPDGIVDEGDEKTVVVERPTDEQLGQWSLIALLVLAMYTFPHESTTRYPRPSAKKQVTGPLGYEDYDESLGIVSQLARMGYLTMLTLDGIGLKLETVAAFYPVVEARFK